MLQMSASTLPLRVRAKERMRSNASVGLVDDRVAQDGPAYLLNGVSARAEGNVHIVGRKHSELSPTSAEPWQTRFNAHRISAYSLTLDDRETARGRPATLWRGTDPAGHVRTAPALRSESA